MESNNTYTLTVKDVLELKKYKLSGAYKEVISRPDRTGIIRISVNAGKHWINGVVAKSNIGYNFRGQISTDLYPKISRDMTFYDMIFGE